MVSSSLEQNNRTIETSSQLVSRHIIMALKNQSRQRIKLVFFRGLFILEDSFVCWSCAVILVRRYPDGCPHASIEKVCVGNLSELVGNLPFGIFGKFWATCESSIR